MKLREIMTSPVLTLTRGESASDALALMRDAGVRHGVVVAGTEIVGVVSERDLGGASGARGGLIRKGASVADFMREDPLVASPQTGVTKAALLLREHRVGCLPVVEHGRLVGVVTRGDVLGALAHLRRRERAHVGPGAAEIPRAPRLVSPNRDKWP